VVLHCLEWVQDFRRNLSTYDQQSKSGKLPQGDIATRAKGLQSIQKNTENAMEAMQWRRKSYGLHPSALRDSAGQCGENHGWHTEA